MISIRTSISIAALAALCVAGCARDEFAANEAPDWETRCLGLESQFQTEASLEQRVAPADGAGVSPDGIPSSTAGAVCKIKGVETPVEGSKIGYEVWLPAEGWNGRILMIGNGGYSSSISYQFLEALVAQGYAAVGTDTGHTGDDPDFAKARPQAIEDWGHRAVHVSITKAKDVVRAFYGRDAKHAYFNGCSTGGHQALMAAQRYPDDFDGIVAGAPGHNRTHLNVGFLWQFVQNHDPESGAEIIPASKLPAIANRALAACGASNGAEAGGLASDPFLNDPLSCAFDPAVMRCDGEETDACLTEPQIVALSGMYDGARNPRTNERIYFGFLPGSEAAGGPPQLPGWSLYWADPRYPTQPARATFWKYWALDDPDWDWRTFDFDEDVAATDHRLAEKINAMSADLGAFRARGGKLLHYHGLADPVVPASDSVSYFERVQAAIGDTSDFYRMFLVPGMNHCYGGPGPYAIDTQAALEAWVEDGEAPERLIGSNPGGETAKPFTRPICAYPGRARYDGAGDDAQAASFACEAETYTNLQTIGDAYLR